MKCLQKQRISSRQDCLPEKLLFFPETGLTPNPSKFLPEGSVEHGACAAGSLACLVVATLGSLWPQNCFIIECLPVESGRAGRFVLGRCSRLPLGCCRCLISSRTAVVMKQRAGGGHGWWPFQADFSSAPITAISAHKLQGPSPAPNSASVGVLMAITCPGDPQPLCRLKT